MAIVSLNTIKNWFKTGLKPTQAQFWDTWDSFRHKSETVPVSEVSGLDALLLGKASQEDLNAAVGNKVTVIAGQGLISDAEKIRLSTVVNFDNAPNVSALSNKVDKVLNQGLISDAEKIRLSTVVNFDNAPNVSALNAEATARANADTTLNNAIAQVYIDLRDGVATQGNTLQKLYNLIIGSFTEITVATITARNAYNVLTLPLNIFVTNDGDGKWAVYKATTTGVNAIFVKINDQDSLNNALSASAIKTAYESNPDTNAFTNALLAKLNAITGSNTGDETLASIQTKLVSTTNLPEGTNLYFTVTRFLANLTFANIIAGLNFTPLNKAGDTITGDIGNTATGFFRIPSGTTAQRPVMPLDGMRRYNTTTLRDEFSANGSWRNHARLEGDTFTGNITALNLNGTNSGDPITTTISIVSSLLTTQNIAGFVTYLNARTLLAVAANEILKFQLSDTGRMFEVNLRGRSFGTGQPAIVAANVLEITEFLNKDIRLSNYPSTRNDGQLPTNKVLAPDANGNIKLYTIATAPAPYLEVLVPDSTLPSTTTNFTLKGAFFTPTMTVAIAGQTINYITFKSDNLVLVNVTTGATEGSFAVTLNNGLQAVFPNALLIVLGTVFTPTSADWTTSGNINISEGSNAYSTVANTGGYATYSRPLNSAKNYRVYGIFEANPLVTNGATRTTYIYLHDSVTDTYLGIANFGGDLSIFQNSNLFGNVSFNIFSSFYLEKIGSTIYLKQNGVIKWTFTNVITNNMILKIGVNALNIKNIKYIELAS